MVNGEETIRREVLPPRFLPPVRAIDIGVPGRERIAGVVVRGGIVGARISPEVRAQLRQAAAQAEARLVEQQRQNLIRQKRQEISRNVAALTGRLRSSFLASIRGLTRNQRIQQEGRLTQTLAALATKQQSEIQNLEGRSLEALKAAKGFIIDPLLKFSAGKFEFQQKLLERGRPKTGAIRDVGITQTEFDSIRNRLQTQRRVTVKGQVFEADEKGDITARRAIPFKVEEAFDFVSRRLLRVGERVAKAIAREPTPLGRIIRRDLAREAGIPEEEATELLSTFLKFATLGRLFATGTLTKQQRAQLGKTKFEGLKDIDKATARAAGRATIERKVAEAPTLKEQLKILNDIKKRLKTPDAIKDFDNFVKELSRKQIFVLPKAELAPGVTVRGLPAARPTVKIQEVTGEIRIEIPPTLPTTRIVVPPKVTPASLRERERVATAQRRSQLTTQIERQKNRLSAAIAQGQSTQQIQQERQRLTQLQQQRTIQLQVPSLALREATKTISSFGRSVTVRRGFVFPPFAFSKKRLKAQKLAKRIRAFKGFNVFGKGVKTKKFFKLNRVPLTRKKARDLGGFLIDHSLARTFKLRGTIKKAQKPILKVPANYFAKNKKKFRNFRIVKGERIPTPFKWIEKRGKFLLDTRDEKRKITLFRRLSTLKKKFKLKSTKMIRMKKRK